MKKLIFLAILFIVTAFSFRADVRLQYTFNVGDAYEFVQTGTQSIKQTLPGAGDITTDVETSGAMVLKITELTADGAKIEAMYTRLKIATKGAMMNMTMDSESTGDDMPGKIVRSMMNKTFTFTITKSGQIGKVENFDNIYSGLNALGLDDAALASTRQAFQQTISEKSLKAILETGFISYPENKIGTGDSWKSTTTMPAAFPIQVDNVWNLKTLESATASVDADAIISTPDKEKVFSLPNGLKSKTDLSGRQTLKGKIDVKSGWPTEIKVLSEIKGKMILLAGSMVPEDMDMPMEIMSESTYTITKK